MNKWFTTIINPEKPTEMMPSRAFELYSFRKAASMYFGVAYPQKVAEKKVVIKTTPKVTPKLDPSAVPIPIAKICFSLI